MTNYDGTLSVLKINFTRASIPTKYPKMTAVMKTIFKMLHFIIISAIISKCCAKLIQ